MRGLTKRVLFHLDPRRGERPAGRAELLANAAIRAQIFAGSIQTLHNLSLLTKK